MKPRRTILSLAVLAAALSVAAPVQAQGCLDGSDSFQSRLEILVSDFYRVADLAQSLDPTGGAMLHQSVADFEQAVREALPEQLTELCEVLSRHPGLAMAAQTLESVVRAAPAAGTSCLVLTREEFLGIFVTSQVLKGVAGALETACEASKCVSLACTLTCPLATFANRVVLVFDSLLEENDYCGKSLHFGLVAEFAESTRESLTALDETLETDVIPPLDQPLSSRASQASVDLLQGSVDGGFTAVDTLASAAAADLASQGGDRESFQEGSLRQRIEANLQAGEIGRIARFQLPASVGGLLEQVREVVAQTLIDNVAAGHDVADAFDLFAEGDAALNSQTYKDAFGSYRAAYRAAVDSGVFGKRSDR